ncbi:MAG: lysophospholipid acyltransferase family protein [Candidatus Acidiferrales bacterium]
MREALEYYAAWLSLHFVGALPRPVARAFAAWIAMLIYRLRPRLDRAAMFNLRLAFPEWTDTQRRRTIRGLVRQLGWMAAEFTHFPDYTRENIDSTVVLDGFENFATAQERGRGVLLLTGHMSAWELGPFAHAIYAKPIHFLARPLDNLRVDALVNRYRCLSGNQPLQKNQSARATLNILRDGGTIGILADVNMLPEEGVFVDFFGIPACSTTGIARLAQHTGAAVVPAYLVWDANLRKYRLCYEPAVELSITGDEEHDIRENTARFMKVIENYARAHPEQWLWIHKRWKTRPPGEPPLYPF